MLDLLPDDRQASDLEPSIGPQDVLSDLDLLHGISIALIGEQDRNALYGKIVVAAVTITCSQFGAMQRVCPKGDPFGHAGELQLLYHRNLPAEAVGFWQWASPAATAAAPRP